MQHSRAIAHIDLDAFYASVEQMDDPSCAGLPVLVGGDGARSVVCAASYEARAFGCRAAMPMGEARRRCPSAIIRPVRMRRYQELSDVFMDVLQSFSPLVESLSLDEAFVDLSGTQRLFGAPAETVVQIVARVHGATGLNCSIGLAPSKFVAKIASDLRKPRGVVIVDSEGLMQFLAPLDISRMWGVGPVAEERFRRQGYATFADLQRVSEAKVFGDLGDAGRHAWQLAQGIDARDVVPERAPKSIGQEETFEKDTLDIDRLRQVLLGQTETVARRLRRQGLAARTVTLKLRFSDFQTVTRRATFSVATDIGLEFWSSARELFDQWASKEAQPLRLIGVSLGGLEAQTHIAELFPDPVMDRQRRLDGAADAIRAKFGVEAVNRAAAVVRTDE